MQSPSYQLLASYLKLSADYHANWLVGNETKPYTAGYIRGKVETLRSIASGQHVRDMYETIASLARQEETDERS